MRTGEYHENRNKMSRDEKKTVNELEERERETLVGITNRLVCSSQEC